MISYNDMISRIDTLDSMYTSETDGARAQLIAKLTALEIGGWLEEFFDSELLGYISQTKPECYDEMHKEIGLVYNFTYKDLRKLIIKMMGMVHVFDIELKKEREVQLLSSSLGKIKDARDKAAHTSVSATFSIAAPNLLKREFVSAYSNAESLFAEL